MYKSVVFNTQLSQRKKIFILKWKVYMICLQQCLFNFGGNLRGNVSGFQAILNYL